MQETEDIVTRLRDEADKRKYDGDEALVALLWEASAIQPCGHPASLLLHSAETGEPLYCELCDAQSGRWDAEQRETELAEANAQLRTTIATLRAELETERMRLAACGVVAMANTQESAARAREMHPDYWCASVQDVARAVDREMALRAEEEEMRRDAARYRWLRGRVPGGTYRVMGIVYSEGGPGVDAAIDSAMQAGKD